MKVKYHVAPSRIVFNRLGMPGYLIPGFLAVTKITENARTSVTVV